MIFTTSPEISSYAATVRQAAYLGDKTLLYQQGKKLYEAIQGHIAAPAYGLVKVVDSMDIMRAMIAMAEGQGLMKSIGPIHGLGMDDWLRAWEDVKELHTPGADIMATKEMATDRAMELSKLLATGEKGAKEIRANDEYMKALARLDDIRQDIVQRYQNMIDTLTEQITDLMVGKGVRLRPTAAGIPELVLREIPTVAPVEAAGQVRMEARATPIVQHPYPVKQVFKPEELVEYQRATVGEYYRQKLGEDIFADLKTRAGEIFKDDALAKRYRQLYLDASDDIARVSIIKQAHQEVAARLMSSGATTRVLQQNLGRKLGKYSGAIGALAGLGVVGLWQIFQKSPAEEQSDAIAAYAAGTSNAPVISTAIGAGAAAAGIYYGKKLMADMSGLATEKAASMYGPRFAVAAALGYLGIAGLHNLLNDASDPDFGGVMGAGFLAGAFGIMSNVSARDMVSLAIKKVPAAV